jgi:hypothetical protein
MSDLAGEVRRRAGDRCEYCRLPQSAFKRPFHIEHIIARQHGGHSSVDNLALACWNCNLKKGPNLSGIDPATGRVGGLFNPRKDDWEEHFAAESGPFHPLCVAIRGLTPCGRATVQVLGLNDEMRQLIRHQLWTEGLYAAHVSP